MSLCHGKLEDGAVPTANAGAKALHADEEDDAHEAALGARPPEAATESVVLKAGSVVQREEAEEEEEEEEEADGEDEGEEEDVGEHDDAEDDEDALEPPKKRARAKVCVERCQRTCPSVSTFCAIHKRCIGNTSDLHVRGARPAPQDPNPRRDFEAGQ